jgi:hypothetical protein
VGNQAHTCGWISERLAVGRRERGDHGLKDHVEGFNIILVFLQAESVQGVGSVGGCGGGRVGAREGGLSGDLHSGELLVRELHVVQREAPWEVLPALPGEEVVDLGCPYRDLE